MIAADMLVSSPRWTLTGGSFTCKSRGTVHVSLDGPTHQLEYRVRVSIASPASLYASISSLLSFARCRLLSAIRSLSKPAISHRDAQRFVNDGLYD
jgi:hypothetical protein